MIMRARSPTGSLNTICTEFTEPDNHGYSAKMKNHGKEGGRVTQSVPTSTGGSYGSKAKESITSSVSGLLLMIPGKQKSTKNTALTY